MRLKWQIYAKTYVFEILYAIWYQIIQSILNASHLFCACTNSFKVGHPPQCAAFFRPYVRSSHINIKPYIWLVYVYSVFILCKYTVYVCYVCLLCMACILSCICVLFFRTSVHTCVLCPYTMYVCWVCICVCVLYMFTIYTIYMYPI